MDQMKPPTERELSRYADKWNFGEPSADETDAWRTTAETWFDALDPLAEFEVATSGDRESRTPTDAEDPNAAYVTRTDIRGTGGGRLDGVTVAIKDNIAVADVPMTCGSRALAEHRPAADATVVRRVLDAGGTITGKTTMSEFALGGDEGSMRFRRPRHPADPDRYPGGSSSGSAVAVAEGSADVALGSDTAASIRCPAAFCGLVGIKPTPGLVSTRGFVGFAPSLDAIGTLSRDVRRGALLLQTIAGEDGADERTFGRGTGAYLRAAERGRTDAPAAVSVGVPESVRADTEVAGAFETALDALETAGATVDRIAIPGYEHALPAWLAIAATEFRASFGSLGDDRTGELLAADGDGPREFGPSLREFLACAEHLRRIGAGRIYRSALRARTRVADGVEHALDAVDVIAMPTMPTVAPRWDERTTDHEGGPLGSAANTAPFNVSGHPAVSIPCGRAEGLPVGLQLVGPRYREERLLRIASSFEAVLDASAE